MLDSLCQMAQERHCPEEDVMIDGGNIWRYMMDRYRRARGTIAGLALTSGRRGSTTFVPCVVYSVPGVD